MYSSVTGGIVTDPALMLVPVDDHVVHRGDGVFESLKAVNGALYNVDAHLQRLAASAAAIGLPRPEPTDQLRQRLIDVAAAAGQGNAGFRLIISRGPGSLGVNPNDAVGAQVYIIAAPPVTPFMQRHPHGIRIGFSRVTPKTPPMSAIKSCNYLINALMAGEASERDLDVVIGCGADEHVLEGPTENIALVTADQRLLTPRTPEVLAGTTLQRLLELAEPLRAAGTLRQIAAQPVSRAELEAAAEVWIVGTSHDVAAVRQIEDHAALPGAAGPLFQQLAALMQTDITSNAALRTPFPVAS
jgi:branched-chain amino acid aminotransferase